MITRQDYRNWDEDDEDSGRWARPGSSEAINQNRQLRRKPSHEDRHIRQKNRRTAADEGDQVAMNNRADIVRKIQKAATLDEQLALVAVLEEWDREVALQATASRGQVDLEATVADRLSPVRVHEHHTAATDWMGDLDVVPTDWHQRVAGEASVWYHSRSADLKADNEEFTIQANDKARAVAGAYMGKADAAKRTFLDFVAFLHTGASGLDQIQQTVDANNSPKTTPLPAEVFDNFAPDIDPVNKGVSGTESSTRNPLLQEILSGGDGAGAEKVNEHDEGNDLSWSPPSGMQKDTAPGFSDGDPGSPERADAHNTDFGSDSEYSKHTSMWYNAAEQSLESQNAGGEAGENENDDAGGAEGSGSTSTAPSAATATSGSSATPSASNGNSSTNGTSSTPPPSSISNMVADNANKLVGLGSNGRSPAIGYVMNMDDFREMQAAEARRAEGKGNGHRGGRTASSTPDAGNAADDLDSAEEQAQAKKDDPVGGKVGRNLTVQQQGARFHVIDQDTGSHEGSHHSEDAARDHIDFLENRVNQGHRGMPGNMGGAGWHQPTRYASTGDGFKPHSDAHYVSGDLPSEDHPKHEYSHGIINGEQLTDNAHGNAGSHAKHPLYSEAASGLDQIDQVIDANNQVKVTPNGLGDDPYAVAFPLNDAFKTQKNTHGTGEVGEGDNDATIKDHHTAGLTDPYYSHNTPDHIIDGSQWAEHRTKQALHSGDVMSHARAAAAHADVLNNLYGSGHEDGHLEAHHTTRMNYHDNRVKNLLDSQRHEAILDKVADMFGGGDGQHRVLLPVANNPLTTPDTPESASKAKGKKDADENKAPTFSDNSSHVPAGAKSYSEGYASGGKEAPKNEPPSMQPPGKGVTHAGSNDHSWLRHGTKVNTSGGTGTIHGSVRNEAYGPVADVVHDNGGKQTYHVSKIHPADQSLPAQGNLPMGKASNLITTAADRVDPEYMKGYFYAAKWNLSMPLIAEGSSPFEAGLYAGLTDNPQVQPHFVEASRNRGMTERLERHAVITQSLANQLGMKVGSTSLYLDTTAPNTSPSGDGSTPINGHGKPGPLDGKNTGDEPAGGPSPYNGAEPHGKPVVPGAASLEAPSPKDTLIPDSGYTTPRAVEKASAFRRRVQAGILREGK